MTGLLVEVLAILPVPLKGIPVADRTLIKKKCALQWGEMKGAVIVLGSFGVAFSVGLWRSQYLEAFRDLPFSNCAFP